jgi:hypothetical protein
MLGRLAVLPLRIESGVTVRADDVGIVVDFSGTYGHRGSGKRSKANEVLCRSCGQMRCHATFIRPFRPGPSRP